MSTETLNSILLRLKKLSSRKENHDPENQLLKKINTVSLPSSQYSIKELREKKDEEIIAYFINQITLFIREETKQPFEIFDEQKTALIRAIHSYRDQTSRGLILEMKTGEGKSSVVIPLLIAYLATKGEKIMIHEVNPYLLRENYHRFVKFAERIGLSNQIGLLENFQDEQGIMDEKQIIFGLWSTFVHYDQHQFLHISKKKKADVEEKPWILILDEVDQILNEEAITPAIISSGEETPSKKIKEYFQQLSLTTEPLLDKTVKKITRDKNFSLEITSASSKKIGIKVNYKGETKEIILSKEIFSSPDNLVDCVNKIKEIFLHHR